MADPHPEPELEQDDDDPPRGGVGPIGTPTSSGTVLGSYQRPGRVPKADLTIIRTATTEAIAACAEDGMSPVLTPGERNMVLRHLRERHRDSISDAELDPLLPNGMLLSRCLSQLMPGYGQEEEGSGGGTGDGASGNGGDV